MATGQLCLHPLRDNTSVAVHLDKPVACDIGGHFAIREAGKTVGSGVITEVGP